MFPETVASAKIATIASIPMYLVVCFIDRKTMIL